MRNMQGPNRQANLLVSRRYTGRAAGGAAVTSGGDGGKVSDPADGLDAGAGVPPGEVRAASVWPGASKGAASASSDKGGAAFSSAPPLSDLPARRTFNFEPMISCTRSLLSGSTIIRCFSETRMSAMGRQVIHWGGAELDPHARRGFHLLLLRISYALVFRVQGFQLGLDFPRLLVEVGHCGQLAATVSGLRQTVELYTAA